MSNNKLFVGNLSFNTTENDLQDAFAAHGKVLEAILVMDRMTNRPRGFGFVTMSTDEEAQAALGALNLYYVLEIVHRDVTGMRLDYQFPMTTTLVLLPTILGAAFVAALWPAESAVRGSLVEALEYE